MRREIRTSPIRPLVVVLMLFMAAASYSLPTLALGAYAHSNIMSMALTGGVGGEVRLEAPFSRHFAVGLGAGYFGYTDYSNLYASPFLRYYTDQSLQGLWTELGIEACSISYTYNSQTYDRQFRLLLPLLVGLKLNLLETQALWLEPFFGFAFSLSSNTFLDNAVNTFSGIRFGLGIGYSF